MTLLDEKLAAEQHEVEQLLRLFAVSGHDYQVQVYPDWTAKDVLAHIVTWHESFARNLADLAAGRTPTPLRGSLRDVNDASVRDNVGATVLALRRRLRAAQRIIERDIHCETIGLIPYRQGSRPYGRVEHLEVVATHVRDHFWHVVTAYVSGRTV